MKRENEILVKLNDVFLMNEVIENVYIKVCEKISDVNTKAFLKEKSLERHRFSKVLQNEINKLDTGVEKSIMSRRRFHLYTRSFSNLLQLNDNRDLLNAIYKIELLSMEKYNELLREVNLSLPLCRLLIKQLDTIQYGLNLIKKEDAFVA